MVITGDFRIDDRVYLTQGRVGTVRYIGKTKFSKEKHLGVELDRGFKGENNGSFGGHQHFHCPPQQGVFILPEEVVERLTGKRAKTVYKLQDRIELQDGVVGTVRYIGTPRYEKGLWYGIELDDKDRGSKLDGTKNSTTYFKCNPGHGRFVQLHEIFTRLDLKEAALGGSNGRVNTFISLHVTGWPLGFMFDSNSAKAEVLKVFSLQAQKAGLQPGHILEFINSRRVGHLSTEQVLDRLTIADWPIRLKFVEVGVNIDDEDFQEGGKTARPSVEVGVNSGYLEPPNSQFSKQSAQEIRGASVESFEPESDDETDNDKNCVIS